MKPKKSWAESSDAGWNHTKWRAFAGTGHRATSALALIPTICPGSDINDLPWRGYQSGPGSDVYQQSALAMESVWPWLRYQSGNSLSQTRLNKHTFILTHSVTDKFITSVFLNIHIYILYKTDLGKPILMKHYHTSSSSSPPSNSCRRREMLGPDVGQILRLCWLFRGRGLAGLEVVRL